MALRKPTGSLRPIAIGESIRRITSKVAVELISNPARTGLESFQLGVWFSARCGLFPLGPRSRVQQHWSGGQLEQD